MNKKTYYKKFPFQLENIFLQKSVPRHCAGAGHNRDHRLLRASFSCLANASQGVPEAGNVVLHALHGNRSNFASVYSRAFGFLGRRDILFSQINMRAIQLSFDVSPRSHTNRFAIKSDDIRIWWYSTTQFLTSRSSHKIMTTKAYTSTVRSFVRADSAGVNETFMKVVTNPPIHYTVSKVWLRHSVEFLSTPWRNICVVCDRSVWWWSDCPPPWLRTYLHIQFISYIDYTLGLDWTPLMNLSEWQNPADVIARVENNKISIFTREIPFRKILFTPENK